MAISIKMRFRSLNDKLLEYLTISGDTPKMFVRPYIMDSMMQMHFNVTETGVTQAFELVDQAGIIFLDGIEVGVFRTVAKTVLVFIGD